jgi:protein O-GlcNAc transferase
MIDFSRLVNRTSPVMYDMDVLSNGEIGGYCKLNKDLMKSQVTQISALQTWAPELQHFSEFPKPVMAQESKMCDKIIQTPTFIIKIDASM